MPEANIASPFHKHLADDQVGLPRPAVTSFTLPAAPTITRPEGPVTRPAPPPIEIPPGDPIVVAGLLSAAHTRGVDADVAGKLAQIETDIAAATEDARTHPDDHWQGLIPFTLRLGALLGKKAALVARQLGTAPVSADVIAADVFTIVKSVSRFASLDGLRDQRVSRVNTLARECRQCEAAIQSLIASPPFAYSAVEQEKLMSDHGARLLRLKQQLGARLAAIAGVASERARAVRVAIEQAGGHGKILGKLTDAIPSEPHPKTGPCVRQIAQIDDKLAMLDLDSQAFHSRTRERAQLVYEQRERDKAARGLRRSIADDWLSLGAQGDLDALAKLATVAAAISPEFADAIARARGDEGELIAVVGEILEARRIADDTAERGKQEQLRRARGGQ